MGDVDEMVAWLRRQLNDDERWALACAEVFPAPWDVSDRGHSATVKADEPHFPIVAELEQSDAVDGWLGDRLEHIVRHDPARVLREVAAKRRILDLHEPDGDHCGTCLESESDIYGRSYEPHPCQNLRLLASMYADRPGYRDAWRPV